MNTSGQLLICGFVLFVVIFVSLSSVPVVLPYSKSELFSKEYPYEGFAGVADAAVSVNSSVPATDSTTTGPVLVTGFNGLQSSPSAPETPSPKVATKQPGCAISTPPPNAAPSA